VHTKEIVASFEFNDSMKQTGNFVDCKSVCWQFQCISYYYFYLKTTFNCTLNCKLCCVTSILITSTMQLEYSSLRQQAMQLKASH